MPVPRLRPLLAMCLLTAGCGGAAGGGRGEGTDAGVRQELARQEAAWDRGDVRGYMAGYAEDVCFISPNGRTCGREAVTQRYLARYPDRTAMGDLRFGISEVLPVGDDHAWCTGTWELGRAADTLRGGFSLLWHREAEGWRIVRDHTW